MARFLAKLIYPLLWEIYCLHRDKTVHERTGQCNYGATVYDLTETFKETAQEKPGGGGA